MTPCILTSFLTIIEEYDPNGERIFELCKSIKKDTACYKTRYQERKKGR